MSKAFPMLIARDVLILAPVSCALDSPETPAEPFRIRT